MSGTNTSREAAVIFQNVKINLLLILQLNTVPYSSFMEIKKLQFIPMICQNVRTTVFIKMLTPNQFLQKKYTMCIIFCSYNIRPQIVSSLFQVHVKDVLVQMTKAFEDKQVFCIWQYLVCRHIHETTKTEDILLKQTYF